MTRNGMMRAAGPGVHVATVIDDRAAAGVDSVRRVIGDHTFEPISVDSVRYVHHSAASVQKPGRYGHHTHEQATRGQATGRARSSRSPATREPQAAR